MATDSLDPLELGRMHAADWKTVRKAHPLNQILPATSRWCDSLPLSDVPSETMKTYPRIANRIALAWRDPRAAQEVLDDLLIDRRGGRQGFSPFVIIELMRLQSILDGTHSFQVLTHASASPHEPSLPPLVDVR